MKTYRYFSGLFAIICFSFVLCHCGKQEKQDPTRFTKADSLTETYLALQDSLMQAWNIMIHDDNRKIKFMQDLLHELSVSNPEKKESLNTLEVRLNQLIAARYDQNSMSDTEIVTEYDFASNALITELISVAESEIEFASNTTIQRLVDEIRLADQRVNNYREEYDLVATKYNRFIKQNRLMLKEFEKDSMPVTKPLFEMAAE